MRLAVEGISKRFGETVALDDVSFAVEPGQVVGFVGPNGAGKTTTMRIVLGVLAADAGEVRFGAHAVDPVVARRFGYMPEERGLYPKMRVGDQLTYLARLHGASAADARAAADRWTERLGVAERRRDAVEKLSLGNQQRVQLAAALVHDPDLLVLDEPFSGLDPVAVDALSEVLAEAAGERGVPVLFSSHQLELVERICDAVVIVRGGRVVADGLVGDLLADGERRVRVDVDAPGDDWVAQVPGARVTERHEGGLTVALADGAGPAEVLDAARAAGRVTHLAEVRPTLAERFREVVADDG